VGRQYGFSSNGDASIRSNRASGPSPGVKHHIASLEVDGVVRSYTPGMGRIKAITNHEIASSNPAGQELKNL